MHCGTAYPGCNVDGVCLNTERDMSTTDNSLILDITLHNETSNSNTLPEYEVKALKALEE